MKNTKTVKYAIFSEDRDELVSQIHSSIEGLKDELEDEGLLNECDPDGCVVVKIEFLPDYDIGYTVIPR